MIIILRLCREVVIFLTECVLSYLPASSINRILSTNVSVKRVSFIAYEMTSNGPEDTFSQVMLKNLRDRGLDNLELFSKEGLSGLFSRYFGGTVQAQNMLQIYDTIVSPEEHQRLNDIEMMDEWEEWNLILQHYCLLYCTK